MNNNKIKELRIRLMKLARGLKIKRAIKATTIEQKVALKIAKQGNQTIYGSAASSRYVAEIQPKDIDINVKNPRLAALQLKKALLLKGIEIEVKKKFIPTMQRNVYEVGTVSYSPFDKRDIANSILKNKIRSTNIQKEILALSGTISNPYTEHRLAKDILRLKQIKSQIPEQRQKEYIQIIEELEKERKRKKWLYTYEKTKELNLQKIQTLKEQRKKSKWL